MTESAPVTIIVDDSNLEAYSGAKFIVSYPEVWTGSVPDWLPAAYNDSWTQPTPGLLGVDGWELEFVGVTSVTLYGITAPLISTMNQTIGISNPSFDKTVITDPKTYLPYTWPAPALGGAVFTTGTIPNASDMAFGLTGYFGLSVDYVTVTVGEFTDLTGQTILVDDFSSEIAWSGSWLPSTNFSMQVPCQFPKNQTGSPTTIPFTATMPPHGNTSHSSMQVGDSFTFEFAGTSVLVGGFSPGNITDDSWIVEMQFAVDGHATQKTFSTQTPGLVLYHFPYFSDSSLTAGNHTLVANITRIEGAPSPGVLIDYITYDPSFATASEKPNFHSAAGSAPSSTSSTKLSSHHRSSLGAIIGGVLGGCVLLLMILGFLFYRRRRKIVRVDSPPTSPGSDLSYEPFTIRPSVVQTRLHDTKSSSFSPSSPPTETAFSSDGSNPTQSEFSPVVGPIEHSGGQNRSQAPEYTGAVLESQFRDLQSQVEVLTREVRGYIGPPSYAED